MQAKDLLGRHIGRPLSEKAYANITLARDELHEDETLYVIVKPRNSRHYNPPEIIIGTAMFDEFKRKAETHTISCLRLYAVSQSSLEHPRRRSEDGQ